MKSVHSKSSVAFATIIAVAFASGIIDADATRPFFPKAFLPKSIRNSMTIGSGNTDTTLDAMISIRGGEEATEEKTLDEKVYAAMQKLGLKTPDDGDDSAPQMDCKDGVCTFPGSKSDDVSTEQKDLPEVDPYEVADRIAKDMNIDSYMSMAALGATSVIRGDERFYDEAAARAMLQTELDLIATIPEDSETVKQLTGEGFDVFATRRALAFAENNADDARAILLAEQMDAEEEEREKEQEKARADTEAASDPFPSMDTSFEPMAATPSAGSASSVDSSFEPMAATAPTETPFDPMTSAPSSAPTTTSTATSSSPGTTERPAGMPPPAKKEDVVFEATTDQIQELVLESPVPVLVDFHAEWCGPCKALGPALEDMAVQGGGMFRLVKINSDNEKTVSQAMEVTALPTVFGISEGKIVHMFQGMPKSSEMMQNFMMGLFGAAQFNPPVTADEMAKYEQLTNKLIKAASSASFSFTARERLTDRVVSRMDDMVKDKSVADVEKAANLLRTFLNNIVNNPYDAKFRAVNLENKVVASTIGQSKSCLNVLKSLGFVKSSTEMTYMIGKRVINIAPLVVARDTIDKWIQKNRAEMAAAARKRQDEINRANLVFEEEEEESEEVEEIDPNICKLRLRLDGKNKIHEATLQKDDPITKILDELGVEMGEDEIQITCVAKRLVVRSSDKEAMAKSLEEHGLMPAANIVVKVGASTGKADTSTIKERAAGKKARKTGSHTMQSIGVYSTEDNNKSNLIDGGGGVLYEHDLTDDEDEGEEENGEKETEEGKSADTQDDEPKDI